MIRSPLFIFYRGRRKPGQPTVSTPMVEHGCTQSTEFVDDSPELEQAYGELRVFFCRGILCSRHREPDTALDALRLHSPSASSCRREP